MVKFRVKELLYVKKIAFFLIILFQLSACNPMNSNNTPELIEIEGYEINDITNSLTNVNSDYISSEYLDLKYSGDKTYNIDVQIWERGELLDTFTEVSNLQLSDYDGISFELDESDKKQYHIAISFYQKSNKISRYLKFNKALTELNFVDVTNIWLISLLVFLAFGAINSNRSANVLWVHSGLSQNIFLTSRSKIVCFSFIGIS